MEEQDKVVSIEVLWDNDKVTTYKAKNSSIGEYSNYKLVFKDVDGDLIDINKKFVKKVIISNFS